MNTSLFENEPWRAAGRHRFRRETWEGNQPCGRDDNTASKREERNHALSDQVQPECGFFSDRCVVRKAQPGHAALD
jgi:hypothetical protein